MFIRHIISLIVISLCFTTSCVSRNPSHKLHKIIETDVFINSNDKLCFNPDFSTATVDSVPHDLDEVLDLLLSIDLNENDKYSKVLEYKLPENQVYRGHTICLRENVSNILNINKQYTLSIVGLEPKRFFHVSSGTNFIYRGSNTIQIVNNLSD